jgi:hypothetical protein
LIPYIPEISVFRVPLATAGETQIRQRIGYFHLWRFEAIDTGAISLDGELSAVFGGQSIADDAVPLSYNSRIQFRQPVELVTLRWSAQANTRAVIMVAPNADGLEANNIPARQLVFQGQASSLLVSSVAVGTVQTTLRNANPARQRIVFQAPITNPSTVAIGGNGVTMATGILLEPGQSFVGLSSQQYRAIAPIAGNEIRWMEEEA